MENSYDERATIQRHIKLSFASYRWKVVENRAKETKKKWGMKGGDVWWVENEHRNRA